MNNKQRKWVKIIGLILLPTPITIAILAGWGIRKMREKRAGKKKIQEESK